MTCVWPRSGISVGTRRAILGVAACIFAGAPASAWDAHGHRTITYAALDALPPEAPAWIREPAIRDRIAWQSNEADRWRCTSLVPIGHENKPDHYIDVDLLDQFGLTLTTVSPFRYEYLRAMAISKHEHPEKVEPYDPSKDDERTKEWPGFLPHAITEHYAKLISALNTLRILERLNEPGRAAAIEQTRANAIHHMGMLSHFVGDAAQPLHTTRHHHGWVGENPNGYTTESGFHSEIDGRVLRHHGIVLESLAGKTRCDAALDPKAVWSPVLAHIQRSFDQVEPLYQLKKTGELAQQRGKEFIVERLADGASMLSAMYWAAWRAAEPTDKQVSDFLKYDDSKPTPAGEQARAAAPDPPGK